MQEGDPFWQTTPLEEMTPAEWESLCDGCARCCLLKLEDVDTGEVSYTEIACRLLDLDTCRCTDYTRRQERVPGCVRVTPELARRGEWLPSTCAYRLVAEGRDLQWWHPLISGNPATVHEAGISVRNRVVHESRRLDPEDHIVSWPE